MISSSCHFSVNHPAVCLQTKSLFSDVRLSVLEEHFEIKATESCFVPIAEHKADVFESV